MASLLVASEARRHAEWCRAARDDELVAVTELSSPKGTLVQVLLLPEYAAAASCCIWVGRVGSPE